MLSELRELGYIFIVTIETTDMSLNNIGQGIVYYVCLPNGFKTLKWNI